jgi:predicted phosphoribosyltransferase
MNLFENRTQAGQQLAKHLENKIDVETVIIPYFKAYEVVWEVSTHFDADVMPRLADFISSPEAPYAHIGAVAEDGTIWVEDALRKELKVPVSYISNSAKIKSKALKSRSAEIYSRRSTDWASKNILIVSDGISSGFREAAVAGSLKKEGAENVYVAAPHISDNMMADLDSVVEEVFYLNKLAFLSSPDACYADKDDKKSEESDRKPAKRLYRE